MENSQLSTSADVCTHCGIAANRSNVIEFGEFHTCEHCQGEGSCTKQSVLGALLGYSCKICLEAAGLLEGSTAPCASCNGEGRIRVTHGL